MLAGHLQCPCDFISQLEVFKIQLIRIGMSIHELLLAKCDLCSHDSTQLRTLFKQLRRKIALLLLRLSPSHQERAAGQTEGFQLLLRVLGLGQDQKGRGGNPCKHLRLFKMLLKSLNCNWDTLDYLCDLTAAKVAERNYTLALMETQLKNVADRVATEDVEVAVVKEEEVKFASLRTIPSQREIGTGLMPIASQTSLEEPAMDFMPAFPFYCHFPIFFGSQ